MKDKKIKIISGIGFISCLLTPSLIFSSCNNNSQIIPEGSTYSITYAGVGGATNPNTITSYTLESGQIKLKDPVKDGFIFKGWTYNGKQVTSIDCSWGQDITLVANWSEHFAHLEFEWDLDPEFRFYLVGEPFRTSFCIQGRVVSIAPTVYLVYGESYTKIKMYYNSGNYVHVSGYDCHKIGKQTITIDVDGIQDGNTGAVYKASKSYETEVKDYDHDFYGYEVEPGTTINVDFPDSFTLRAKAKHENSVAAYNWVLSNESIDHDESCNTQNYKPYQLLQGPSVFTNTLLAPTPTSLAPQETFKLITIYDDMTRVYTKNIEVNITTQSKSIYDDILRIGDYIYYKNATEPFDLAKYNIGTGTIRFEELDECDVAGYDKTVKFTFNNVNYVCNTPVDNMRGVPGLEYFYTSSEKIHFVVEFVGNNSITNTYLRQDASGIDFNIQYIGDNSGETKNNSYVTFTGKNGNVLFIGGSPALYVGCPLEIDTELNFTSYLGRFCNAINANTIRLTQNAIVRGTNNATGLLAIYGDIVIDDGAQVDFRLSIPRVINGYASLAALNAGKDIKIRKANVYISAIATPEIYQTIDNFNEGVDGCVFLQAGNKIEINGGNVEIHAYATFSESKIPMFGIATGMLARDISIEQSSDDNARPNIIIDLQTELFNRVYGFNAANSLILKNSTIDIDIKTIELMCGIYCSDGNVDITDSKVTLNGWAAFVSDIPMFGLFSSMLSALSIDNSQVDVNFNHGIAIASLCEVSNQPKGYSDDPYSPKQLDGFTIDDETKKFGLYSARSTDGQDNIVFLVLETVYDLDTKAPTSKVSINNHS